MMIKYFSTILSDFELETHLTNEQIADVQQRSGLLLSPSQRQKLEYVLQTYEVSCQLREAGEGSATKQKFSDVATSLKELVERVTALVEEPGHLWEWLAAEAGIACSPDDLRRLRDTAIALTRAIRRPGRPDNFFLSSMLGELESIFISAGGTKTGVSKDDYDQRGGRFLEFCWAALRCLPKRFRIPEAAVAARWERLYRGKQKSRVSATASDANFNRKPRTWVGGPHPAAPRHWLREDAARRNSAKPRS